MDRGPHPVLVVDHDEHDRQLPQRRDVHRLAERALVRRAVAEHAHRHGVLALVVGRQRNARRKRQVAADDPVAAQEAALGVEQVHRAAAAAGGAALPAEQLGHHDVRIGPASEHLTVLPVGREQVVLVAHGGDRADDRRLLPDREMHEAADLGLHVHLLRALLEMADQEHLVEQLERRLLVGELALRLRAVGRLSRPPAFLLGCALSRHLSGCAGPVPRSHWRLTWSGLLTLPPAAAASSNLSSPQ